MQVVMERLLAAIAQREPLAAIVRRKSLGEWLASRGLQVDARHDTEKGDTLLTWAARHGNEEALALVLEAGAAVDATAEFSGWTALCDATYPGHLACVQRLLAANAAILDS